MKNKAHFLLLLCFVVSAGFASGCSQSEIRSKESAAEVAQSPPYVRLQKEDGGSLELVGLPASVLAELRHLEDKDLREVWPVFTGNAYPEAGTKLPMLGSYEIEGSLVRFRPRFSFDAGMSYFARFDFTELARVLHRPQPIDFTFTIPELKSKPTFVSAVYPASNVVPENLLKLYVHFSAPMSAANVHDYIRLYDSHNREIGKPFVHIEHGLWDPDRMRLTLFFHPGRIKRGVGPNLAMGPPLKAGESYRLVIAEGWKDARGQTLQSQFEKKFTVTEADRRIPNFRRWQVRVPNAETVEPLVLTFDEPLDHALLHRFLVVQKSDGSDIRGHISVLNNETRWTFTPVKAWPSGKFVIRVNPALEDLAGNRLDGVFDHEASSKNFGLKDGQILQIPFSIKESTGD